MKLSINLNKIALIRNSRGSISPSIEYFARTALEENILGLTAHPRPDNRHIRYEDLVLIRALTDEYQKEFNIEGNPLELPSSEYKGYLAIIEEFKPTQATLVPDELEYAEGYKDVMKGLKEKMVPMDSKSDTSERKENYEDPD